jgi:biotin carboxylase
MKKLLILGGFPQMIDIVATAREMGLYVIVADRDPASPAKRFAHLAINVSTDDLDALEKLCLEEGVNGVFTGFEDFNIHVACELCKRLSLPFYATKEQLLTVTNKIRFKEQCRACGVPVIEQYTLEKALLEGKYPYIVKPADSYGSRGITVCHSEGELRGGYQKAVGASSSKTAIIERFIDHDHGVELFYTVVNGSIHLTVTADRYTVRNGKTTVPLPVAEVFPSRHRDELAEKLDPPIRRMLREMEIQNGLVLIQALYDGDKDYFVYEMAYRFTGEQHYRLVERQHGVQLSKMMIKAALGEDLSEYDTALLDDTGFYKPSINLAFILNPGKVERIEGLEKVYLIDEVISYNKTHSDGDVIAASGDYSHMLIRINMVAESYEKLCRAVALADECVTVLSEKGEDMLSAHFRLPEDL